MVEVLASAPPLLGVAGLADAAVAHRSRRAPSAEPLITAAAHTIVSANAGGVQSARHDRCAPCRVPA